MAEKKVRKKSHKTTVQRPLFDLPRGGHARPTGRMPAEIYERSNDEDYHAQSARFFFCPIQWLAAMNDETHKRSAAHRKGLRRIVQVMTVDAVMRGSYFVVPKDEGQGEPVCVRISKQDTEMAARQTTMCREVEQETSGAEGRSGRGGGEAALIELFSDDCLEVARWLRQKRGLNVAVLNMASSSNPGGGWKTGASSQEESICRRTALFQCLEDPFHVVPDRSWSYPIPEFAALYSPDVPVFRRSESRGYAWLDRCEKVSVISAAAYAQPPTETDAKGDDVLTGQVRRGLLRKARNVLSIANSRGHDCIVLSAWGCGAFGCPPFAMARLLFEAVRSFTAGNRIKLVAFAILPPSHENPGDRNLVEFSRALGIEPQSLADWE